MKHIREERLKLPNVLHFKRELRGCRVQFGLKVATLHSTRLHSQRETPVRAVQVVVPDPGDVPATMHRIRERQAHRAILENYTEQTRVTL
ncbi:MAG: hypothetical protein AB7Q17_07480 [Phycisphaerae bacterium]